MAEKECYGCIQRQEIIEMRNHLIDNYYEKKLSEAKKEIERLKDTIKLHEYDCTKICKYCRRLEKELSDYKEKVMKVIVETINEWINTDMTLMRNIDVKGIIIKSFEDLKERVEHGKKTNTNK